MSGGFFRGTSAVQDSRFSDKQAKLLKSQKFAPELEHLVDMTKIQMDAIRPWIAKRVTELLGFEDEVVINFIYGLLEGKEVNGKEVQISLTGFMEKNTAKFMKELWERLLSAQKNASGVPQQDLDAKAEEMRRKKAEDDKLVNEIQRKKDRESIEFEQERYRKMDGGFNTRAFDFDLEPSSKHARPKVSVDYTGDDRDVDVRNGVRRKRHSTSPPLADHLHSSPQVSRSHSVGRSLSNSQSYASNRRRSRSVSRSPDPRQCSVSSDRRYPSRRKTSISPRSRHLPRTSLSPPRQRSCHSTSSPSRSPQRSTSVVRQKLHSPYRRRSTSRSHRHRSPSPIQRYRSPSPVHHHRSPSPFRPRRLPSLSHRHRSPSPAHSRRSLSPVQRCRSPFSRHRRSPFSRHRRSPSPARHRRSPSPAQHHRSPSPARRRRSPSPARRRRSPSPARRRRSPSPPRRRRSPSPARRRRSPSPARRRRSPSPPRRRRSPSPTRRRRFPSPARHCRSPSPNLYRRYLSPYRRHRSPYPYQRNRSPFRYQQGRSPSPVQRSKSLSHGMSSSTMCLGSPVHVHQTSRLPIRCRSLSASRSPSLVHGTSTSPICLSSPFAQKRYQRSTSSAPHRSPSSVRPRSPASRCRSSVSPAKGRSSSASPSRARHGSRSPFKRAFAKECRRSPEYSSRGRDGMHEHSSPRAHWLSSTWSNQRSPAENGSPNKSPLRQKRESMPQGGKLSPKHKGRELEDHNSRQRISKSKEANRSREDDYNSSKSSGRKPSESLKEPAFKRELSGKRVHPTTPDQQRSLSIQDFMLGERGDTPRKGDGKGSAERNPNSQSNVRGSDEHHETELAPLLVGKVDHNQRSFDSDLEESEKHIRKHKRKHKRSKRKEVTSDDSDDTELEDRKAAKRRKKEEKRLRKEEKRRHREERRHRREERRAEKLKSRDQDDSDVYDGEQVVRESHRSNDEEVESEQKKLEIELRQKALESLKAKKGIGC